MTLRRTSRIVGIALMPVAALVLTACGGGSGGKSLVEPTPTGLTCADGTFTAAGSTVQTEAIAAWSTAYHNACASTKLTYEASGPEAGVASFLQGSVMFAGAEVPLTSSEKAAAAARCKTGPAVNLPMLVVPIAIAYHLSGVTDLQLAPTTIAKIFANKIKMWNDPAIAADNPGVTLPATKIRSFHRSGGSSTTNNFTTVLTATAASAWPYPAGRTWAAPAGDRAKGPDGVARSVSSTNASIGYMEYSVAKQHGLTVAKVKNASGAYVALTPAAATAAVATAKQTGTGGDLALSINYTAKAPGAYPLVVVTYEITCEKGLTAKDAAFATSFLGYTASRQGQSLLPGAGFAPLPAALRARTAAAAARIA